MTKKLLGILVLSTFLLVSLQVPANSPPSRVPITLPADSKAILLAQMLGHMVGLDGIVTALGQGDYDAAAKIASTELGTPRFQDASASRKKAQGPGLRIGQHLPAEFREIGGRFRSAANAFADLARSMPDKPSGVQQQALTAALSKVTNQCRICHDRFRIE